MSKNPAFMYYPKDWRADPVWACTLAARGLWHEMMDRMHEATRYGYLEENGKPIPEERIARMCGTTLEEYTALFAELSAAGVPRRTASGVIYCKRMVEDEKKRREWRKRQIKHRDAGCDKTGVSRKCHALSSSSSSNLKPKTPLPPASGGEESYFEWNRETVAVKMGRRRRLPSFASLTGAQTSSVVDFLRRHGFEARICEAA